MDVRVCVPAQLRDLVGGNAVLELSVGDAADEATTVTSVLDALAAEHPALERRVRDEQGRTRRHVNLFIGAENMRDLDGPSTAIHPGQDLSIIPAVSGG